MKVVANLQTDNFQPKVAVLKKNISGSIEGEAIQKDITGAIGTPPISKEVMIGITPHDQNGLKAPTIVARRMETNGLLLNIFFIDFAAPVT